VNVGHGVAGAQEERVRSMSIAQMRGGPPLLQQRSAIHNVVSPASMLRHPN